MTAKQYLRQLSKINAQIIKLTEEVETRRSRLTSITSPVLGDKVQSSPAGDIFAAQIAALADKDLQRRELILIYEAERDKIVDEILAVDNQLYQDVLYQRYVKELSLERIAVNLNYNYNWIRHIHGQALQAFARQYPEKLFY